MSFFRFGYILGLIIGALWGAIIVIVIAISFSLLTGEPITPSLTGAMPTGAIVALLVILRRPNISLFFQTILIGLISIILLTLFRFAQPLGIPLWQNSLTQILGLIFFAFALVWPLTKFFNELPIGKLTRHEFEEAIIRFLMGFGYLFFILIVAIPFFIMVMTSLKSQQALLLNPLDYSLDISRGWALFRSYIELFNDYSFGNYLINSFFVSIITVLVTLLFSVPGAYAVARLRFKGQAIMSRSILLIYMVPMIVLALPIYIAFSMVGLRNSIFGILLIYPVTTIPVALYMLQGYFRGLPFEVEEAGLMDGLTRLKVIWQITLPLSLPAIASVSLYVFMIAWNELLLAFMLLDDPSKFTLTRGVAMLNSSEIPRQHLMAGSVIATIPIMLIFLGLERFMTKGLTAGSVKG